MGRKSLKEPTRSERLAEALVGVHSTGATDKEAMRELVLATIQAFRQGVGIHYEEFEEMLDELYYNEVSPDPVDEAA